MIRAGVPRTLLLAAVVSIAPAYEASRNERGDRESQVQHENNEPSVVPVAGCESAIVGNADPRWRERSTVVRDLGFYGPGRDFRKSAHRFDIKGADLVTKLPVIIEGTSAATVWVPRDELDQVALHFGDGVAPSADDSYRVEDGHPKIRFEPCVDKKRTGWPGGLILFDRREIVLRVQMDGASRPATVTLGRLPTTES